MIVIDDEEIIAAMSYKSNRNWTLPAPQISLLTPNTCDTTTSATGILTGNSQTMYVTYRFTNENCFTNSLHCNYYTKILGNNNDCNPDTSKNVAVRFGSEFGCLIQPFVYPTTTTTTTVAPFCGKYFVANSGLTEDVILEFDACCDEEKTSPYILSANSNTFICSSVGITISGDAIVDLVEECTGCTITTTTTAAPCPLCDIPQGYFGDTFQVLAQRVTTGNRPDPTQWREIDFTYLLTGDTIYGFITQDSLTGTTFVISEENYNSAPLYNLNNYIEIPSGSTTGNSLNFGDEYYFYGALETDIQATIYEMKYKINLSSSEFQVSTNPSWTPGSNSYITEIALLDSDRDILVMSKLQSPTLRQGIQQYVIKIDI
jgi:hypothetical protein